MKLSDYVAKFLKSLEIRHVFAISGGASLHLIHSVVDTPGIEHICLNHEQASAIAADAYSRVTGNLGAAMVTSGPGATNLLTGVACAFYDSVPVIYITGQVSTFRSRGDTGVRQIGFQETDTVEIFKPVTKYSVQVTDPEQIRYEMEKACFLAKEGRPGPVVIDIPDNIQREQIDPKTLRGFSTQTLKAKSRSLTSEIQQLINFIKNAQRPVLILGWGIRLAKAEKIVNILIEKLGFPVVPTWAVADILPNEHPLAVGTFGTHGTRYSNFTVQNADLILSLGSRLDTKATGSPITTFARGAKKVMVDIDENELNKFKKFDLQFDLLINDDVADFINLLIPQLENIEKPDLSRWFEQIQFWKNKYPICKPEYWLEKEVNPYVFVENLSKAASIGDIFIVDTGNTLAWMMQGMRFKSKQRLFHDWNNTAMGWALPASIAASLAMDRKSIICVIGDGSLLMNLQELASIERYEIPVKIFLINNFGYSMIRQTQDQWLGSNYYASSREGGLSTPDFQKIAGAFNIPTVKLSQNKNIEKVINQALSSEDSFFCEVEINPNHRVIPQVKFGRPNEDPAPLLARDEFNKNMLIPLLEVSRNNE